MFMSNTDNYFDSLSDKKIQDMIETLKNIQNHRAQSYIKIMSDRNGPALDSYLLDHDNKLSPGMLDNFTLDNFTQKDIPFYESLKKCTDWEKIKTTSHIKSLYGSALNDKDLIDYFINNDKHALVEYIVNCTKQDLYPLDNVKKLYKANVFDLKNSHVRAYFVINPNESILMYGLENNLLNLEVIELKMLFVNTCTLYNPDTLEAIKAKIPTDFVFELKSIIKNLGSAYPDQKDSLHEAYYSLTLAEDSNFEYIINNTIMTPIDLENILRNLEEAFPLRKSKVQLLSQAVAQNEVLAESFINFRKKIVDDNFTDTFDNAALYVKLHKILEDKTENSKFKI